VGDEFADEGVAFLRYQEFKAVVAAFLEMLAVYGEVVAGAFGATGVLG